MNDAFKVVYKCFMYQCLSRAPHKCLTQEYLRKSAHESNSVTQKILEEPRVEVSRVLHSLTFKLFCIWARGFDSLFWKVQCSHDPRVKTSNALVPDLVWCFFAWLL